VPLQFPQYMYLCEICYDITKMIKLWIKEDAYVTLLYFGVAEEYAI